MKKILIITNHSYMFWQFRRELVAAMLERGHQVTVALPFGDRIEELRGLGCQLVDTPMNRRGTSPVQELALIRTYTQLINREKPDVVVTYSVKPNIYAASICAAKKIPCCVNIQGIGSAFQNPKLAGLVSRFYRGAMKQVQVAFFENQENARQFRQMGIMTAQKQCVLPGAGVNLERYQLQEYPRNETVRFLFLGRLMREKGVDELLGAAALLRADGLDFHLDVAGFEEESYLPRLKELEDQGLCTYHGFQTETRQLYAQADCVVLPSYHEGMSNVLLEAAASGRPVITSDIPGCREAVEEGVTGLLCPARDERGLYSAMKRFLNLDSARREAMGAAGRARMEAQFDKKLVVDKTLRAIFRED